jgi:hypothetical protein
LVTIGITIITNMEGKNDRKKTIYLWGYGGRRI